MASVVISSLVGGRGPGLVSTAMCAFLGFLLTPPAWTLRVAHLEDAVRICLFAILGALISTILGVIAELQRQLYHERGTLALTLRSIGDGVIVTDEDGRITFLNDMAEKSTGWVSADAIDRPIEEVLPLTSLESRLTLMNPARQVLKSGLPAVLTGDTLLRRRDGTEILIGDSAAPIRNDLGSLSGAVLVFQDITRVRAGAELERRRLRDILANAPAAIGVLRGPEHRWEYVNNQYVRVTGRKVIEEFVGKTLGESLPEIVSQPFISLADEVYRTGIPYFGSEAKATLNRAEGEPEDAYFDFVYQPLRDVGDRIDGILVHAIEVTDRVVARQKIKEAEKTRIQLATIVESTGDAIISKDLNGIVTSWNPAAEKILGYTAQEMIGRSIIRVIPPELHHEEQEILSTIARGERIEQLHTTHLTKSGERIFVSLTISPLRDETGTIIGASKILRDITRQKKAERALHQAEKLASVGRLAATVAHEINNPLEAVTNLVYLANGNVTQEEAREYLRLADEELKRVAYITRQTLGFYRETSGATMVRLGTLLATAISIASRTRNKRIKIVPEIKQDPEIHAVPGEMRQLLANLLSNSIDAVDASGCIRVRVSAAKKWAGAKKDGVRLVVADSGSGIPAELRPNLFQPFFTTRSDVGTGLGLWICKNIVEKHGGSIRVKSSTAQGRSWTVFSVYVPSRSEKEAGDEESRAQLA